jgi:hypothetical protein
MVKSFYSAIILFCFSLSIQATPIDVSQLATSGNGSQASCWQGWDTAVTWVGEQEYYFPSGVYCYSTSPNFLKTGIALRGEAGAVLKHTGSGNAITFDDPISWTMNVRMENFIIQGNSATTNGLFLRGVRNGVFKHISVRDVSGAGIWTEACVTNILDNFRVTRLENPNFVWNVKPAYGIVIAGRGADTSTYWTITNPVIEDVKTVGIWIKPGCFGMNITGGTVEMNTTPGFIGALIEGPWNRLESIDFEANSSNTDIQISQQRNFLTNVLSGNFTHITAGAANQISGGRYHNLTIDPYVHLTIVTGIEWTGTFIDQDTLISTIKFGNVAPSNQGFYRLDSELGNVIGNMLPLNFGPIINTDCITSSNFSFFAFGNFILANPVNGTNGQKVTWRIGQDSVGSRLISFGSKFRAKDGTSLPVLSTTPRAFDYITAVYNSAPGRDTWDIQ